MKKDLQKAVDMMDGGVDMSKFVSEVISIDDFQKGLDDAEKRPLGFVKAIFKFD